MSTFYAVLADLVAIIHGSLGVLMIWALWPVISKQQLKKKHTPRIVTACAYTLIVVFQPLLMDGCPVTKLEKYLIKLSGHDSYNGGFLYHYFGMSSNLIMGLSAVISMLVTLLVVYRLAKKKEVTRDKQTQKA